MSFCPERTAEGKAIEELVSLPQIISGRTSQAVDRARELFGNLTQNLVEVTPEEAELAKLFTNSWRYIKFAAANQFLQLQMTLELTSKKCDTQLHMIIPARPICQALVLQLVPVYSKTLCRLQHVAITRLLLVKQA